MALGATVQLKNSLPELNLAGNKIPLQFEASTNLISSAGSVAEIVLTWTAVAVADEYFDLLLFGETIRFTCKAAPDNSGIQFRDNTLGGTLQEWVALVSEDLMKNYLIARYYDLVTDGAEQTLTAKVAGADYSLEFTAGAGIDCNAVETNKTGADEVLQSFYYIIVLLYCNNVFVTELALDVDEDGLAEADVSDLLKSYMENDFTWPELTTYLVERANAVVSWYFRYGEKWGDSDYRALALSSTYYVLNGGLSFMQQAKMNKDSSTFWAKFLLNQYFLSWAPLVRYVSPTEPIKLYFLNHEVTGYADSSDIFIKARTLPKVVAAPITLITGLFNIDYETFTSSGEQITSAIETGIAGSAVSSSIGTVDAGERIKVSLFLTLNSGQAPSVFVGTGGSERSDTIQLEAGQNDIYLTISQTEGANCFLYFKNTAAANFSTGDIMAHRDQWTTADIANKLDSTEPDVYEMIVSPARINYAGLSAETLDQFEIWVQRTQAIGVISETRTFIVDYSHYEHERYFLFKNSFGCYECLRTTGLMTRKEEYSREFAKVDTDSDYTSKDRQEITIRNEVQQVFTVSAGWLSKLADAEEYRNWLRDFSLSKEVFLITGNTLKPVRVISSSFVTGKDRDNLRDFTFDFAGAFADEFFTKEITPNLDSEDFAGDFEKA